MKKTFSIIALIIVIIAALPFITGLVAKNRFENLVAQIQAQNPNLTLHTNYHLGWLSSRAQVDWSLNSAATQMPALQHEVIVHHGPLAFFRDEKGHNRFFLGIAVLNVELPQFTKNPLFTIDFQKKVFSNTIHIPFNLHYRIRLHALLQATVSVGNKPLFQLNLDNLMLRCNFTHDLSKVQGQFLVDNFKIMNDATPYLTIPKIEININHHTKEGVYLGNESVYIPSIDLLLPSFVQFKMQTLTSSFIGEQDKNNVTYKMGLSMNNASYNGESYGPFAFDFQIGNLSFKALSQIQQKIQAYVKAKAEHPDNADALQDTLAEDLRTLLPTLIQANTTLTLKQLDFSIPTGSVRSNGTLVFSQTPKTLDMDTLRQNAELNYHLATSQDLAQTLIRTLLSKSLGPMSNTSDAQSILAQLIQMGLIKESNGFYGLDIQIKQGIPYVNERPFNPAILQQLQLAPSAATATTPVAPAAMK